MSPTVSYIMGFIGLKVTIGHIASMDKFPFVSSSSTLKARNHTANSESEARTGVRIGRFFSNIDATVGL